MAGYQVQLLSVQLLDCQRSISVSGKKFCSTFHSGTRSTHWNLLDELSAWNIQFIAGSRHCGFSLYASCNMPSVLVPSVLRRCWLVDRKGIWPVKNWVVRCWCGYLSGVRYRFAYAQLMPLPLTISCSSKSRLVLPAWFYLSGIGSPG